MKKGRDSYSENKIGEPQSTVLITKLNLKD